VKNVTDKQKQMVVVALAVVIMGVGAFQLVGSPAPIKKARKVAKQAMAKAEVSKEDPSLIVPESLKDYVAGPLPVRDPFDAPDTEGHETKPNQKPETQPKPEVKPDKPGKSPFRPVNTARRTARQASQFNRESTAPLDPMVGALPQVGPDGTLAASSGQGGTNNGAQVRVEPGKILRQPGEFAYQLSGVVIGDAPAVVLQDDSGKQRLVRQGGAIDGDSRVVSVNRNAVVVRHNGKNITLKLGGSPETK